MSQSKHNVAVENVSLNQEQDQQKDRLEREIAGCDSEMKCEHDLSSSSCQLRERGGKAKVLGKDWHERMQDTSSELAHKDMKKEQKKEGNDCVDGF